MTPTAIVAYLLLFAVIGFLFVFACLLLGKFLRSHSPTPMKLETYECGEPAVGSGAVQFDLRFYVVALVFLVFEVEVAMFFPTATIFGKSMQLLDPNVATTTAGSAGATSSASEAARIPRRLSSSAQATYKALGVPPVAMPVADAVMLNGVPMGPDLRQQVEDQGQTLALASMVDLGVFFAVLLVGFAFVWSRGDLDWVRAVRHPPMPAETAALAQRLRSEPSR